MKTPEEIKKGLAVCATLDGDCENCPYDDGKQLTCVDRSRRDALAYIIKLEGEVAHYTSPKYRRPAEIELSNIVNKKKAKIIELESRLAQVEKEKDALLKTVNDLKPRKECSHYDECVEKSKSSGLFLMFCQVCSRFEWRGVCEENTKENEK